MTRYRQFFIFLFAFVFIIGCSLTKPEPEKIEHAKPKPQKTIPFEKQETKIEKPTDVEPIKPEPQKTIPDKTEPNKPEPNEPKTSKIRLEKTKLQTAVNLRNKCAAILNKYVDEQGMVDYAELRYKKLQLNKLLEEFNKLDQKKYASWPQKEKIAFWINAYNIQFLNIIIQNYPINPPRLMTLWWPPQSIRHIGLDTIWSKSNFIIMDEQFTISQIEKTFFRKKFDDTRIFFALCNGCLSSPPLQNEPYTGKKLDTQLEHQVKRYLSSKYGLRIDRARKTVYLSGLLQSTWFGNEFINKYGTEKKFKNKQPDVRAVLNFIINYIPKKDVDYLETANYSVEFMKYNWNINGK